MRKITALAAALAATVAVGNANAVLFVVDEFNSPHLLLWDKIAGDSIKEVDGPNGPVNPPANTLSRTVTHELIVGNPSSGAGSSVTIGDQSEPTGSLNVNNGSGRDSEATVSWILPTSFIPDNSAGPAFLLFKLLKADLGIKVDILFNNSLFGTQTFASYSGAGTPIQFAFTAAQQNQISSGGTLELRINGPVDGLGNQVLDWDFALDAVGLQIPEPATLALVGLALIGAGVASRRRSA